MTLRLPDKWLWDFWFAREGADYHIFYLQAPRSLAEESLRHWNASIGHAVSSDLRRWETLPDALHPNIADSDAWDNYTTWTGSVLRHDNLWYMFYTGGRKNEHGLRQRIGLATSRDLIHWERCPSNPLILLDPTWYEALDDGLWHDQAWRDPWVFRHPSDGHFHAFITARINDGPADGRGVIAHAQSEDLITWEVLPPITQPGEFGHMEVPQLSQLDGRSYLLFSTSQEMHSEQRRNRSASQPATGVHYLVADQPLGPYAYLTDEFLLGDPGGSFYSGKLIQMADDSWSIIAYRHYNPEGDFIGELAEPMPVTVEKDGRLRLEQNET
jgi:beta-fructofuranosidase